MDHPNPQPPISATATTPTATTSSPFFFRGDSSTRCCCFPATWHRMHYPDDNKSRSETLTRKWWRSTVAALMKAREWSEIVAGPRWKTFIRRFNRSSSRQGKNYGYDPLSYSLNFEASPEREFDFTTRLGGSSNESVDFGSLDPRSENHA